MKVREGDVLVCKAHECNLELTVTKECETQACGEDCEIVLNCCDEPMEVKKGF